MKQSVIKEMATNELEALLETEQARLEKMKVNHMVSPLENPKQLTFARKTIARINTELRSRELIEAQN
ncbi:MAG: 50S ribosomal protein L29 [Flavobacteriales bacterium]|jgi:large subunit ribosomal protein L29|nr:50S ribosomal protein L29 [Flavobacteriales bacterium]|tara:strand:+ start:8009 stop:8212 length:204 start_codon:yes stop_codon:yes gene_type:complete